ncbi:MAG: HDOD domain-containing protein, partial [Acidobacteriota bacterium]
QIARQDPSLLAAILQAVNTRHLRLRGKVGDLQQAITLLGLNQVHQIVLDHGLRQTMPDSQEFHQLRDRALLISLICFELAQLQEAGQASALSALGLLHNIGESILLLLMRRNPELKVLIEQLDQARLGALLLRQWNLPESIWRAIHFQDFPFIAPSPAIHSACRREVAFLFLARLCHQHLAGEQEQVYTGPFFDDYRELTGIPFASLPELAEEKVLPALVSAEYNLPDTAQQFLREAVRRLRKRFEIEY